MLYKHRHHTPQPGQVLYLAAKGSPAALTRQVPTFLWSLVLCSASET